METATQERTSRTFDEATMPHNDAAAFSLGVAQRLISSLTDLSIVAAKENARLAAELQITALEALHDAHSAALRWQPAWSDACASCRRPTGCRRPRPTRDGVFVKR